MKSRTKTAVDTRTVIRLVSRSFPRSRVETVTELSEGMFNTVFLITGTGPPEGEVILKIGPEAGTPLLTYEKDIMRAEVRAYRLLEGKGLPVPRVFASCFDRELIDCDYFFMGRQEGVLWKDAEPHRLAESRPALMEELGRINRTIHSVTGPFFGYLKEEARFSYATWAEAFTGMVDDLLEDGRKRRCRLPYEEIRQTVAEKTDLLNRIKIPAWWILTFGRGMYSWRRRETATASAA